MKRHPAEHNMFTHAEQSMSTHALIPVSQHDQLTNAWVEIGKLEGTHDTSAEIPQLNCTIKNFSRFFFCFSVVRFKDFTNSFTAVFKISPNKSSQTKPGDPCARGTLDFSDFYSDFSI